jgi:hypothetical protein
MGLVRLLFEKKTKLFWPVTCSPSHRQAGAPIPSHFASLPICVQKFHSQCYLVAAVIHIKSLRFIYVYLLTYSSKYRDAGREKNKQKMGKQCISCAIGSSTLV